MAKMLGSYKEKELNQRETNNVEIFGKRKKLISIDFNFFFSR